MLEVELDIGGGDQENLTGGYTTIFTYLATIQNTGSTFKKGRGAGDLDPPLI